MSPAETRSASLWMVTPAGRALVWAKALVKNNAICARVTLRLGEKVVAVVPVVTPISYMTRMAVTASAD